MFAAKTVENAACIARNIAVLETKRYPANGLDAYRTYFVDDGVHLDRFLASNCNGNYQNNKLFGLSLRILEGLLRWTGTGLKRSGTNSF